MQEISQTRINLGIIESESRDFKNYLSRTFNHFYPAINSGENLDLKYLSNILASETFLKSASLKKVGETYLSLHYPEANQLGETLLKIYQLTLELPQITSLNVFQEQINQLHTLWTFWEQNSTEVITQIKNDYKKLSQLHLMSAKAWTSANSVVFHGIKFDYATEILETNKIKGYTTQRYWEDGRRRTDADPDYEASLWLKGISTTRSLEFAANWAPVVVVLDLQKIKQQKEVVPFAWNYHISQGTGNFKKETEEFVILKRTGRRFIKGENPDFLEEYNEGINSNDPEVVEYYKKAYHQHDHFAFKEAFGELEISNLLMGVFLVGYIIDIFGIDHPTIQQILNHPKFIGILEK